jgi:two-component system, sensor histidine kinase PdtaS
LPETPQITSLIESIKYRLLFSGISLFLAVQFSLTFAGQPQPVTPFTKKFNYYLEKSELAKEKYNYIQADLYLDSALLSVGPGINQRNLATIYLKKGVVKNNLNDFGQALDFFLKAKEGFEKLKDWNNLVVTYVNIAEFYRKTANFEDARDFIQKALACYEKYQINDLRILNKIYNRSAAINNEFNPDPAVTLRDSRKALELAKILANPDLMAVSYNEMGYTYKNMGKVDSAEIFYKNAEKLWMEQEKYREVFHVMANRAQLYQHNNYPENEVINLYKRIVFLSDSLDVKYPLMNVSWALYAIYINKGDTINAYRYFSTFHDESTEFYNLKTRNELHNVQARFKNEEIQNQYLEVSHELSQSSKNLEEKRTQQLFLILILLLMGGLLMLTGYLFFRLRASNRVLSEKNREKDTLIQEIHHRVKNNLQFISSLINMQVKNTSDEKESNSLYETSRRINAMALVHEMLYNSVEEEGISLKYYLEELIDSLYTLVNSKNQKIDIHLDIVEVEMNVSDTISLGMITSELISNSMKHAFEGIANPRIVIQLTADADQSFTYTVSDNGKGTSNELNMTRSLGLRLVDIFSRQLKGTYHINGVNGFVYTLKFTIR